MSLSNSRQTYREILHRLDVATKEIDETLAFLDVVEPFLRTAFAGHGPEHIVDVGGGRGLTAFCWLCLSEVARATVVDQYMPVSYMATLLAVRRRLGCGSPDFVVGKLGEFELPPGQATAFVGIHCCGSLTDEVINAAIRAHAPFAVMSCCHPHTDPLLEPAAGWLKPGQDPSCLIDLMRLDRARTRGYVVSLERIDERITPKNLILLGKPRAPSKKPRPERVPSRSSLGWAELKSLRSKRHHLGRILHDAGRGTLTHFEPLAGDRHTNLRVVDHRGEEYVLRLCGEAADRASAIEGLEREQRFCEIARGLGVPVPEVLAVDGRGKLVRNPFMLRRHVPGEPLSSAMEGAGTARESDLFRERPPLGSPVDGGKAECAGCTPGDIPPSTGGLRGGMPGEGGQRNSSDQEEPAGPVREQLLRKVGQLLRRIHSHRFEQAGLLAGDGVPEGSSLYSHTGVVDATVETGLAWLREHGVIADHRIDRLRSLFAEHRDALATANKACTLTHGDFQAGNVLVDVDDGEWRVAGIIDAERCASGDPWWDLATFELGWPDGDQQALDAFLEGYGGRGDPGLFRTRLLILMLGEPEQNLAKLKAMALP